MLYIPLLIIERKLKKSTLLRVRIYLEIIYLIKHITVIVIDITLM